MSTRSQAAKIVALLKANPDQKMTARQIAEYIIQAHPEDYQQKRQNPRFVDDKAFLSQVVAEIGAQKAQIVAKENRILWQDKPRPRVYWYASQAMPEMREETDDSMTVTDLSEQELYPILIDYLKIELDLYCQRIDEKRSKNNRGNGGNKWLHPDIVAMEPLDKGWHELIRSSIQHGAGQRVRLWSFEVKKTLTRSNVRSSFFQAVSNSSWANEGYLVATAIANTQVEHELRILSALHGIGVIILNPEDPSESEWMLPAKAKSDIDWQSVNRILEENADFKNYIELVSTYYQTGRIRTRDWNK